METSSVSKLFIFFFMPLMFLHSQLIQCSVTYDKKAIVINGQRRILISGSIHYPRSTPDMWEDLIWKAKDGGLDVIDTYIFWNVHEPSPGNYNFEGRYDLVRFIKTVQKVGLFVNLRIGPYVCAEWNFGGFPVWLKFVPGISFRTNNEPFKMAMQGFTQKIVHMMKSENLFASQGGPIILSQIENEYGPESRELGAAGHAYINWAAKMAVGLDTGVPWVMCKEDDAPDPVINACNGFYCDAFSPNKPYKPRIWTEAWSGWFTEFGGPIHQRPVQDLAFGVARFIQNGGSFVNYYMYHGGTNFGRSAGGPFITSSYDYDAPIDEYGLIRQPKYGHLKELHKAIKLCEHAVVSADPTVISLGSYQQAHVFSSGRGNCAAFLSNYNPKHFFSGSSGTMTAGGLWSRINITRDSSDICVMIISELYFIQCNIDHRIISTKRSNSTLTVQSKGHAVHVFIMDVLRGGNRKFTYYRAANLLRAMNLSLPGWSLSVEWVRGSLAAQEFIWFICLWETCRLHFNAPEGDEPLALDMRSMGRSSLDQWAEHWKIIAMAFAKGDCNVCSTLEIPTPKFSMVAAIQPKDGNQLTSQHQTQHKFVIIFEELGGDASKIALMKRAVKSVCADANEHHPTLENWHTESPSESEELHQASVHLQCAPGQSISTIKFASFGTPSGTCGSFQKGTCHAPNSQAILEKNCIGQEKCSVLISNSYFGADPCPNVLKRLSVEAVCSPTVTTTAQPDSR
ncbi:hypothetical protein PVL29_024006 [Vitis rotundifolia]|uniref:Beta-galactosidase n=1 Tax=Vitis rotundifolia TaxID=103349 RepID=A0AA38YQR3_VITRO|nr:hypothetical protein PVL29_024006 [Vitis rotundifolia]